MTEVGSALPAPTHGGWWRRFPGAASAMTSVWGAGGRPHVRSCGGRDPGLGPSRQVLPCVPGPGPPATPLGFSMSVKPWRDQPSACSAVLQPRLPSPGEAPRGGGTPEPPQEGKNVLL